MLSTQAVSNNGINRTRFNVACYQLTYMLAGYAGRYASFSVECFDVRDGDDDTKNQNLKRACFIRYLVA